MPDTGIGARQDMKQEPPDKFTGGKSCLFLPVAILAVTVGKGNLTISGTPDAVIGDSNPMGIATEII